MQQSDNEEALQSVPGRPRRTRWQWGLGMRTFPQHAPSDAKASVSSSEPEIVLKNGFSRALLRP
jgi:hypothetical protein